MQRIRAFFMLRAGRYQRIAAKARENPRLANLGFMVASLLMVMGVLDVLSTEWALSVGAVEANIFMRKLQDTFGGFWYLPKMLMHALVAMMVVWSPNRSTLYIMAIVLLGMLGVVGNNLYFAYTLA